MAKSVLTTDGLRVNSSAYTELYNGGGLQVYALKGGRFEIKCGTTHTYAHSIGEVSDKINALALHQFASSGEEVVANINSKLGQQYRLEIKATKRVGGEGEEQVFSVEGSKEHIADKIMGTTNLPIQEMVPGRRYAMQNNMYGGEYAILVPMGCGMMPEMSPSAEAPMYEKQPFSKGVVLEGIDPVSGALFVCVVDSAYPNGSFTDSNGKVFSSEDAELYQLCVKQPSVIEENFKEPDESMYQSENIPSYNPVGVVKDVAPMAYDLANYDSILSASAGVLHDFMKTARKVAYLDRSSLNKVTVTAVNDQGQATDGEIEWNIRIGSPHYKRSSQITIPLVMAKGSVDIGKEFIISTGQRLPLTVEGLQAHLGTLAQDDLYRKASKETSECFPSTVKADKDVDNLLNGIETASKESLAGAYLADDADYEEVARLIKEGNTSGPLSPGDDSGREGTWALKINMFEDVTPDDTTLEHISEVVKGGVTSGEIIQTKEDGGQAHGWFDVKIDMWKQASKKTAAEYTVNVGNIGNIECETEKEAEDTFNEYVQQSKTGVGRAGGESVYLMVDGEPVKEHLGTQDLQSEASKKTAAEDSDMWYFWALNVDFSEDDAKEDGLDYENLSDEITAASLKVEQNVQKWMETNLGTTTNEGHDGDGLLLGSIWVPKGSDAHKFIVAGLEDEHEEPYRTSSGTLPFDPYEGVEDRFAKVLNVDLWFSRVNNQPDENTPDYSSEPEADSSAIKSAAKKTAAPGLRQNQVQMMDDTFANNILMYKEDIDNGTMTVEERAFDMIDESSFAGYPQFSDQNRQQISDLVSKKLSEAGISESDIESALVALEMGFEGLNSKAAKKTAKSKSLKYTRDDFEVIKNPEGDRIAYTFESKDGNVRANVFIEEGSVELRGMVGDYGIVHKIFPFAFTNKYNKKPGPDNFLDSLITVLERGEYEGGEEKSPKKRSDLSIESLAAAVARGDSFALSKVTEANRAQVTEALAGMGHSPEVVGQMLAKGDAVMAAKKTAGITILPESEIEGKIPQSVIALWDEYPTNNLTDADGNFVGDWGIYKDGNNLYGIYRDVDDANIAEQLKAEITKAADAGSVDQTTASKKTAGDEFDSWFEKKKETPKKEGPKEKSEASKKTSAEEHKDLTSATTIEELRKLVTEQFGETLEEGDIVKGPGKFEGEYIATLYYYDAVMNGAGETIEYSDEGSGPTVDLFEVDEVEKKLFGVTEKYFLLTNTDQGFVYGEFTNDKPEPEDEPEEEGVEASKKTAGFMQPFVKPGKFVIVDGPYGGETVDADFVGEEELAQMLKEFDETEKVDLSKYSAEMYFENKTLHEIEVEEGWVAYLSAPGYMDRTEDTFFKTKEEAIQYLKDEYPEEFESEAEKADAGSAEASKKTAEMFPPDAHQLRILKDTVRNPMKGQFLGGPTAEEAEQTLKSKFHFTDEQINKLKASKKTAVKPGYGFQTEATPGQYYTGTSADATPFAVANADEIPASSKDIRTTKANSVEEAIKVRFGSVKIAGAAIIYEVNKMVEKDNWEGGVSGDETQDMGTVDKGVVWSPEELFAKLQDLLGAEKKDFVVFEDGRLTYNRNEDADGMSVDTPEEGKKLSDAGKLYLADYDIYIKLGDNETEPSVEKLVNLLGISDYDGRFTTKAPEVKKTKKGFSRPFSPMPQMK